MTDTKVRQIATSCDGSDMDRIAAKSRDGFWYGLQRRAWLPETRTGRMSYSEMCDWIDDTHDDDCECALAEFARIKRLCEQAK